MMYTLVRIIRGEPTISFFSYLYYFYAYLLSDFTYINHVSKQYLIKMWHLGLMFIIHA